MPFFRLSSESAAEQPDERFETNRANAELNMDNPKRQVRVGWGWKSC
jgi:hypothetical protein